MTLFIVGLVLFIFTIFGFTISLLLWVYEDAKVKSEHPPALWVILVFFSSGIGIILYFIIGRTKKEVPPPGTHRGKVVALLILLIPAIALFVVGTVNFARNADNFFPNASMSSGSFTSRSESFRNSQWTFSARSANGWTRRSPNLSAEELLAFHVSSSSGDGVTLLLEQGEHSEAIDISGNFHGYVDLRRFEPGRIRVTLQFDQARDVHVTMRWRT